jgi:hypothetical protein
LFVEHGCTTLNSEATEHTSNVLVKEPD